MSAFKRWRRRRLTRQPLTAERLAMIVRNVPYYGILPPDQQRELQGLVQVFLAEKPYEACGGLALTDEIRVTIAAQGCTLLLGRETEIYPKLRSILVYPHAFVANVTARQADGTVLEGRQGRQGESWMQGYVVLSWDDVLAGAADIHDGRNVTLHEFAHQLDNESGAPEGAPLLEDPSLAGEWARVFGAEYRLLCEHVRDGRATLLDPYGTVSPAEFFAVCTEYFFERPVELQAQHGELYRLLQRYYRQDPALMMSAAHPVSDPTRA